MKKLKLQNGILAVILIVSLALLLFFLGLFQNKIEDLEEQIAIKDDFLQDTLNDMWDLWSLVDVIDKPLDTFSGFYENGVREIEILASPEHEEANLGYAIAPSQEGSPFQYYTIMSGERLWYGDTWGKAEAPFLTSYNNDGTRGTLYEVKAVLKLAIYSSEPETWLYCYPVFHPDLLRPAFLIRIENMGTYTYENMYTVKNSVVVKEGAVDIDGNSVSPTGFWAISDVQGGVYSLGQPGGDMIYVTRDMFEWPDPADYVAFPFELFQ